MTEKNCLERQREGELASTYLEEIRKGNLAPLSLWRARDFYNRGLIDNEGFRNSVLIGLSVKIPTIRPAEGYRSYGADMATKKKYEEAISLLVGGHEAWLNDVLIPEAEENYIQHGLKKLLTERLPDIFPGMVPQ